ncbi:hypothetical protein P3T40_007666 [Paraburkholderia sp. EB58]|jgi:hypothetical protein
MRYHPFAIPPFSARLTPDLQGINSNCCFALGPAPGRRSTGQVSHYLSISSGCPWAAVSAPYSRIDLVCFAPRLAPASLQLSPHLINRAVSYGTSTAHARCMRAGLLPCTCDRRQPPHVRQSHFRAPDFQASRPPLSKTSDLPTQHFFPGVSSSPPPHEPATPPRHHSWPFRPCMTSVIQHG